MIIEAIPYLEEILAYVKARHDPKCTDYEENKK